MIERQWSYTPQIFTPEECDKILYDTKEFNRWQGIVGGGNTGPGEVVDEIRNSSVTFVYQDLRKFSWVFDRLWEHAFIHNQYYNFSISTLDFFQIAEYDCKNNGHYNTHRDVFWYPGNAPFQRKLSCTCQLSPFESYEGGEFYLENLEVNYPTDEEWNSMSQQGSSIWFPSFVDHGIRPVTAGTRFSITAWFMGPHWR